jgi:two-component system invasion response regulator UvrY
VANIGAAELRLPPEEIAAALRELVRTNLPMAIASPAKEVAASTRVLLADDHQIVLDGLRVLIDGEHDMKVVARAQDGEAAMRHAVELSPHVVVMDVCMPGIDGIEATRQITSRLPAAKVVALSSRSDAITVNRILHAGATAYLTKHRAFSELIQAIRAVQRDRVYFSSDIARLVAAGQARLPSA